MTFSSLVEAAGEAHHAEPAIHPYLVGAITLGLLLVLLLGLMGFGKGRGSS